MPDVVEKTVDDLIAQWISKGAMTALSAAGGQSAKALLSFVLQGTTDPSVAKLNQISEQLKSIKAEISNLPHDTAVYLDHFNAIGDAENVIAEFTEILTYTSQRKKSWPTYEAYLASLSDTQWKQLVNFLLPGSIRNYFSLCNRVVITAYGQTITDILESQKTDVIKYGESDRSYARYVNTTLLKNQPIDIYKYVAAHNKICHTVLSTITAVVLCAQLVIKVFKLALGESKNDIQSIRSQKITDQITDRLRNLEIIERFFIPEGQALPQFYTDLFTRIIDAPGYLCGNVFPVYNGLVNKKHFFYLKNSATQTYIALKDYDGDKVDKKELTKTDNFSLALKTKPFTWNIRFGEETSSTILIEGKGISYFYLYCAYGTKATILMSAPTQASFDKLSDKRNLMGDIDPKWKLQIISTTDSEKGPGKFTYYITIPKYERSLQNLDFFGTKGLGLAKPNSKSVHNQWEIIAVDV